MKVAVIAEWYPSPADPVHGVWAHRQAVAAVAAGAEVRVLVMRRPVPPLSVARRIRRGELGALGEWSRGVRSELVPWEMDGLQVTPVPWVGPPRPLSYGAWGYWMGPSVGRALSRLRAGWAFDVVHAHNLAPTGHAAALWTRRKDVPLVVSAHGPDMTDVPTRSAVGRHAVASSLAHADLALANSGWARKRCLELARGRAVEIETLHLGADLSDAPSPLGADPGVPLRLVTIAHLQARKHHATVLRAIALMDRSRRPSYVIVGDGEERPVLAALVAELGLERQVTFTGQLDHEYALAWLGDSDVLVMPGVEEPFGVAFIEGMAAGLPAIGGRWEGGPEDIAAAGEGLLKVTPGNAEELAGLLTRLDGDRAELARLGAAARVTVAENFTWEQCGARTVAAYERVLASAATRAAAPGGAVAGPRR